MRRRGLCVLLACAAHACAAAPVPDPLWAYNGTWKVTDNARAANAKPDDLVNKCVQMDKYFACQQTVNGVVSSLLLFVPSGAAGHYSTQPIMPDGRAAGLGTLTIDGPKWVFTSTWNQGVTKTYYQTINMFSGKTKIHFEQQESSDRKTWKTTKSGDEVRVSSGALTILR